MRAPAVADATRSSHDESLHWPSTDCVHRISGSANTNTLPSMQDLSVLKSHFRGQPPQAIRVYNFGGNFGSSGTNDPGMGFTVHTAPKTNGAGGAAGTVDMTSEATGILRLEYSYDVNAPAGGGYMTWDDVLSLALNPTFSKLDLLGVSHLRLDSWHIRDAADCSSVLRGFGNVAHLSVFALTRGLCAALGSSPAPLPNLQKLVADEVTIHAEAEAKIDPEDELSARSPLGYTRFRKQLDWQPSVEDLYSMLFSCTAQALPLRTVRLPNVSVNPGASKDKTMQDFDRLRAAFPEYRIETFFFEYVYLSPAIVDESGLWTVLVDAP